MIAPAKLRADLLAAMPEDHMDFRSAPPELPPDHPEAFTLAGVGPAPGSVPDAKAEAINMYDPGHS